MSGGAQVPRGYDALGVDDALPRHRLVVEAGGGIGGEMLHADADLPWALGWRNSGERHAAEVVMGEAITGADEHGNVAVRGDLAVGNLLHGGVDGVEEGLGLVGARHGGRGAQEVGGGLARGALGAWIGGEIEAVKRAMAREGSSRLVLAFIYLRLGLALLLADTGCKLDSGKTNFIQPRCVGTCYLDLESLLPAMLRTTSRMIKASGNKFNGVSKSPALLVPFLA